MFFHFLHSRKIIRKGSAVFSPGRVPDIIIWQKRITCPRLMLCLLVQVDRPYFSVIIEIQHCPAVGRDEYRHILPRFFSEILKIFMFYIYRLSCRGTERLLIQNCLSFSVSPDINYGVVRLLSAVAVINTDFGIFIQSSLYDGLLRIRQHKRFRRRTFHLIPAASGQFRLIRRRHHLPHCSCCIIINRQSRCPCPSRCICT